MNRIFAHISAPFSPVEEITTLRMKEYCRNLYDLGYMPVCPNLIYPQFLDDRIPDEREARVAMAQALLRRCRVLVLCTNDITLEMEQEIMLSKRLGIVATTLDGLERLSRFGKKSKA